MANTYLYRQVSSSDTNKNKVTISLWFKKCTTGVEETLISGWMSDNNRWKMRFKSDDTLDAEFGYGGTWYSLRTNRKFRDTSGWYNCVLAYDTTQGTASERVKMYINGIQETSFTEEVYPPQNYGIYLVENTAHIGIGRGYYGGSYQSNTNWSGLISHLHVTDGYTYPASTFGSTDSTTGEWQINTSPSITMGNNGFTVLKDGNTYTDQSANSNNFTLSGTLTKTEDNPSNVLATLNPLVYSSVSKTYAHGNNSITASASGDWCSTQSTMGASSGKYYCEIKINDEGSYQSIGVGYQPNITNSNSIQVIGELTGSFGWKNNGTTKSDNVNGTLTSYATGDILMIAMDLDNQKLYFGKNGTWVNSGVPTSGANGTGSVKNLTANEFYHFVICPRGGSNYCNFGNGYFATTAVSSAGTNASGNGIFEYDVPTGYTALSTKGLNL